MRVYLAVVGAVLLLDCTLSLKDGCLVGSGKKHLPSPETTMKECLLYSNSSCCFSNLTEELISPVKRVENTTWDLCQQLSNSCEIYMKKIECFYQCSPRAVHWMNPNYTDAILHVPLCVSFCDSWLDACKDDLTCARNWLTDFKWGSDGNHCEHDCVPFSKMYTNGTDLCETLWGSSFVASSSEGHCLQMDGQDEAVLNHILCLSSGSNSTESSQEKSCHHSAVSAEEISPELEHKEEGKGASLNHT